MEADEVVAFNVSAYQKLFTGLPKLSFCISSYTLEVWETIADALGEKECEYWVMK